MCLFSFLSFSLCLSDSHAFSLPSSTVFSLLNSCLPLSLSLSCSHLVCLPFCHCLTSVSLFFFYYCSSLSIIVNVFLCLCLSLSLTVLSYLCLCHCLSLSLSHTNTQIHTLATDFLRLSHTHCLSVSYLMLRSLLFSESFSLTFLVLKVISISFSFSTRPKLYLSLFLLTVSLSYLAILLVGPQVQSITVCIPIL